jgi:hypothetical protein
MGDLRSMLITGAAVGAAAVGGAAIANAGTSSTGSSTSSTTPQVVQTNPRSNVPPPGTSAHESAEKVVTGVAASKARAAAVRAAGGGKAGQVTTDYSGNGYEGTVTKSGGSKTRNPPRRVLQRPIGPRWPPWRP